MIRAQMPMEDVQPSVCRYDADSCCCYPIDDCDNCPAHPDSHDPYWGRTAAELR